MTTTYTNPLLSNTQLAAVLAGLRLLQRQDVLPAGIDDILTDGGTLPRITEADIDQLCEEINAGHTVGGDVSELHLYQRTYSGFVRISAIVVGPEAANAYMTEHPGTALLSLAPGEVALLADNADKGVPEAKVPRGAQPTVALELPVSDALVDSILCGVIESGLDEWFSWSSVVQYDDPEHPGIPCYRSAMCTEWDSDEGEEIGEPKLIDAAAIAEAIGKILSGKVQISSSTAGYIAAGLREDDGGHIDAEAADCIVQVAMFDELRYG